MVSTRSPGSCVATANVLRTLGRREALEALGAVLAVGPDLVGLQEWGPSRRQLLYRHAGYVWAAPAYGECPIGARADRFELFRFRPQLLAAAGLADRGVRRVPLLPPRAATVAVFRDRHSDRLVSVVCFHLVPATQAGGRYRDDRPRLVARHRLEVMRLSRLVDQQRAQGHVTYALGDSNFDGLQLPGLTSCWEGREGSPGTLGPHRKVDDVFGPGRASSVSLLDTPSDHRAVIATRPRPSA